METSLEADTCKGFAFLQHLTADLHEVKGLHEGVGGEGDGVGGYKALPVHPLVPIAPVLNCQGLFSDTYFPSVWACFEYIINYNNLVEITKQPPRFK